MCKSLIKQRKKIAQQFSVARLETRESSCIPYGSKILRQLRMTCFPPPCIQWIFVSSVLSVTLPVRNTLTVWCLVSGV